MSQVNARGVVRAEVAGVERYLRLSLACIDRIEVAVGEPFSAVALRLNDQSTARFGELLTIFVELCRAGGTPLTDDEREDLLASDLPDLVEAVHAACRAAGALEEVTEPAPKKKKRSSPSRPPGGAGKK